MAAELLSNVLFVVVSFLGGKYRNHNLQES